MEGLLIAILDIDEVMQVIRASDDSHAAGTKLKEVFDLSEEQTQYILELRLRRLTKFSRIELETERDELTAEIATLEALLADTALIRKTVQTELQETKAAYDTPRRTVLSGAQPTPPRAATAPENLQISDSACQVLVSGSGMAGRIDSSERPGAQAKRSPHDALLASLDTRVRGSLGAITSAGVLHVFTPIDLPVLDLKTPKLGQGTSLKSYLGLGPTDGSILAVVNIDDAPLVALGTTRGVVKRVSLAELPDRLSHSLIALKDGDTVVGAAPAPDDHHVVFVTTRGALLNFPASLVRPQGFAAGGMQGMTVPEDSAVLAMTAVVRERAAVITLSGSTEVLPGTESQRAKRTALAEFPVKGRATSGVRAHSFLKGEDSLTAAYVGYSPLAIGPRGQAVELPEDLAKRDASGTPIEGSVSSMGEQLS